MNSKKEKTAKTKLKYQEFYNMVMEIAEDKNYSVKDLKVIFEIGVEFFNQKWRRKSGRKI